VEIDILRQFYLNRWKQNMNLVLLPTIVHQLFNCFQMMKKLLVLLLLVSAIATASAQYQRRVLVEEFTNASCPPCAAQNPGFNALMLSQDSKVTPIKYQTNWPGVDPMNAQNPTDVATRVAYYGVSGVPNGFVDGGGIINDCNYYDNAPACLTAAEIDDRYATTSPVNIAVSHSITGDFDSIIITVSVTSAEALTGALRLHVAVVEEEIVFNQQPGTNGELDFYQVMRKMLPNGGGTTTGDFAAGETKTYTLGWPVLYCYNLNDIGASAWLQNNTGKIVYNSARSVGEGTAAASGLSFINSMPAFICAAGTNPYFTVTNSGTEALTSARFWYKVDAGAWTDLNWTGNLAPGASEVVTLSAVSVTANTTIQVVGVSSNNGAHLDRTDGINLSIKVLSPTAAALPFANTFQSAAFRLQPGTLPMPALTVGNWLLMPVQLVARVLLKTTCLTTTPLTRNSFLQK
jgi:cell division protein FtsL